MTPEQEALAARIADGAVGADTEGSPPGQAGAAADASDPVASNLAHLGRIADAHRAALSLPEQSSPCLFEWRHLKVERELGQGGFGTVYQAWDSILQRRVALKLLRDSRASENRDRLLIAEAQRMARVRHVNILAVHGADSADGRTGIWTDLLEGSTLEQVIETRKQLSLAAVTDMALALVDALALIHQRGIVHGDIKPANIMIQADSTPVLMDFGAAQGLREGTSSAGSPLVMAPEQFTGSAASAASDIYGLGATLYFAIRGKYPVTAESFPALEQIHQQGAQIDYQGIPLRWRLLLRAMLAAGAQDRPSALKVLEQLRAIAGARPRMVRRLATAVVMASLAAGVVAATLAYRTAEQSRERTERVKDLVVDAIRTSSPNDQSGPVTVEETYNRLAELAAERLQDYPAGLADMQLVAAEGLRELGRFDQALEIAREGHELMLRVSADSPADLSYSWTVLSGLLKDTGDLDGSEFAIQQSLAELDKLPEAEAAPQKLVSFNRLATLTGSRGDMRGSLEAHREVLSQRRLIYGPGSIRLAVDYHNVAIALSNIGDYAGAVENEQKAASILEQAGDGQSVRMGFVLQGLAYALSWAGRHEEALEAFESAEGLLSATLPADHPRIQMQTIGEWGSRYHLGEAQAAETALRALLATSDLPDLARMQAHRQLGDLMAHEGRWQDVITAYTVCAQDTAPNQQVYLPYYRAALAYARFQLDPDSESPAPQLQSATEHFEQAGMTQHRFAEALKAWQAALDQA